MINSSNAFDKKLIDNTTVLVKGKLTFANGKVRQLSGDDFMSGGISIDGATSSSSAFDIGGAIIGQCSVTLNNFDERFSDCDFTGAKIELAVGLQLDDGTYEWIDKGLFWVEQPSSYSHSISLVGYDNMSKFEKDYANVKTQYPASLFKIVTDICDHCGISRAFLGFSNSDYVVSERPDGDYTCLQILGYAAQVSGNYVKIWPSGSMSFERYNTKVFESDTWKDGGRYDDSTPYATGDNAEGGNFTSYTTGATLDGGSLITKRYAVLYAISSIEVSTDDVVVTGISVKAQDEVLDGSTSKGRDGETYLYGSNGYVLHIEDNPLIQFGEAEAVANLLGVWYVGMRFRPFEISAISDPRIEPGDPVIIVDSNQNQYQSYVTALTYKVGSYESYRCSAETPSRNKASSFSAKTTAIRKLRNEMKKELDARDRAIERMQELLDDSDGMFVTTETAENGGTVYYVHDKPTIAESAVVWKLTAKAIGFSTDGGETYPYALSVDGTAILEQIYTIGLDASYITSGILDIRDESGASVFYADVASGTVFIDANVLRANSSEGAQFMKAQLVSAEEVNGVWKSYFKALTGDFINAKDGDLLELTVFGGWHYIRAESAPGRQFILNMSDGGTRNITNKFYNDGYALIPEWGSSTPKYYVCENGVWKGISSTKFNELFSEKFAGDIDLSGETISLSTPAGGTGSQMIMGEDLVKLVGKELSIDTPSFNLAGGGFTAEGNCEFRNVVFIKRTSGRVITFVDTCMYFWDSDPGMAWVNPDNSSKCKFKIRFDDDGLHIGTNGGKGIDIDSNGNMTLYPNSLTSKRPYGNGTTSGTGLNGTYGGFYFINGIATQYNG